ncbi:3-deoxy-manno-octulosonate cytidylyltransferase [Chloroflexota bacterium]
MKIIGVIPARYKSSRFPGKPLADICGKPMIWWVYQQAIQVPEFEKVYVATDDERIEAECKNLGIDVVMTSDKPPTGTDRAGEVAEQIKADIYVNIQGDEPLLQPDTIRKAIIPFESNTRPISVTNLMTEIKRMTDISDSTVPKVVVNSKNEAVFLSRLPVPYPKGTSDVRYFKQVCVYGFTSDALRSFCEWPKGSLEKAEDIELLRFIENRMIVQMVEVEQDTVAVDTPADLETVRKIIEDKLSAK